MYSDRIEIAVMSGVMGLLMAGILAVSYFANKAQCHNQWRDSGMQSEYAMFQGCRIKLQDGRWIPAKNYREL